MWREVRVSAERFEEEQVRATVADTHIGVDFGTMNSSVARALPDGSVDLLRFANGAGYARSILYLEQQVEGGGRRTVESFSGGAAIERYLTRQARTGEAQGRLIQSLKSYLPVATLTGTEIFGRRYTLEDLIARMLRDLREAAEAQFGCRITRATVGRPVRFVGAETPEAEALALTRLAGAYQAAGFDEIEFAMEPVAAAFDYEATLTRDELILIGDFGGGTSDFSLVRVGPASRSVAAAKRVLANAGVGVAGDAFDARLVRHLVSPALGSESMARGLGNKRLPAVPAWIYANLERWHYLSFLRTRAVEEILRAAHTRAVQQEADPEKIAALMTLIDEDLGYQLHAAVQRTKVALSTAERAQFHFGEPGLAMDGEVTRAQFEGWIAPELGAIEGAIDDLLERAQLPAAAVDRVFLTGGTSFVPAVRGIFARRFGAERVTTGEAFTSVARGLALRALARG